jgi:hypothetical protein
LLGGGPEGCGVPGGTPEALGPGNAARLFAAAVKLISSEALNTAQPPKVAKTNPKAGAKPRQTSCVMKVIVKGASESNRLKTLPELFNRLMKYNK